MQVIFFAIIATCSGFFISAVCRHFARGHCWQGNMCAFLHVHQDPDSSEDKDTKDKKTIDSTTDLTKDPTEATASSTAFGNAVVK